MRLPRKPAVLLVVDLALVLLAGWAAFWLRFNFDIPGEFNRLALMASPWCLAGYAAGLTARARLPPGVELYRPA